MLKRYIGDRRFYRRVVSVMLPILVQNVITNFVSLLDNLMVGRLGTEPMSGVSIVNQLMFVYILAVWGVQSGAGILTAQFYGNEDHRGVADTLKLRIAATVILMVCAYAVFLGMGGRLIESFLHESESGLDIALTYSEARSYLSVMMWQIVPFGLCQVFAGTLRETNETAVPMKAGLAAVFVNLVFNYILIFGKLGAPALGVRGAAIATVLSRFVELFIIVSWTFRHRERNAFVGELLKGGRIRAGLTKQMIVLGIPMFFNELMWAAGMTMLNQCMSLRGLEVVSALNISSTVGNLFSTVYLAMGTALTIIVGQLLGAGELDRAVDEDRKLIALSLAITTCIAIVMIITAPLIPMIYNTTDEVRSLATVFIRITSLLLPMEAVINAFYFTIRSGGKTLVTFLFDSFYTWVFSVPIAYVLGHFTAMPIIPMYAIIFGANVVKLIIGYILVRKKIWVKNLVA